MGPILTLYVVVDWEGKPVRNMRGALKVYTTGGRAKCQCPLDHSVVEIKQELGKPVYTRSRLITE